MRVTYWLLIGFAFVVILVGIGLLIYNWPGESVEQAGQRGDFFGGHLAAAGSLAGALLFFVAILLQRDELAAQRAELKLTREEMERARDVTTVQADELKKQTKIAQKAAMVSSIIQIVRMRAELEVKMQDVPNDTGSRGPYIQATANELSKSRTLLIRLISQPGFEDWERAEFARAGGVIDEFAAGTDNPDRGQTDK